MLTLSDVKPPNPLSNCCIHRHRSHFSLYFSATFFSLFSSLPELPSVLIRTNLPLSFSLLFCYFFIFFSVSSLIDPSIFNFHFEVLFESFFLWVHWFLLKESELAGANGQLCGFRRWVVIGFGFGIGKRLNCCEFWWLTHLGTIKKLANRRLPSMEGTPATVIRHLCLQRIIRVRLLLWSITQVSLRIGHLMSRSHWKKGLRSEFFSPSCFWCMVLSFLRLWKLLRIPEAAWINRFGWIFFSFSVEEIDFDTFCSSSFSFIFQKFWFLNG